MSEELKGEDPKPEPQMDALHRARFADNLRRLVNSHRTVFAVDKFMFEPQPSNSDRVVGVDDQMNGEPHPDGQKTVSAAALRILLDYCENDWPMGFVEYCAGMFHGRAPKPGETAFDLLPDVRTRINAERLGFGGIYGSND